MECLSWVLLFSGARSVCSVWSPLPRGQTVPLACHSLLGTASRLLFALHWDVTGPQWWKEFVLWVFVLWGAKYTQEVPDFQESSQNSGVNFGVNVCASLQKKNSVLNQQLSKSVHFRNWAVLTPPFYFRLLHFWNKAQLVWQMALGIPLP